jgi:hypothetical protein
MDSTKMRTSVAGVSARKVRTCGPGTDRRTRTERRKDVERRQVSILVAAERRNGVDRRAGHERRCGGAAQVG